MSLLGPPPPKKKLCNIPSLEIQHDSEMVKIGVSPQAETVVSLLGTTLDELSHVLTHRVVAAKGEVVEAKQNPARATWGRDALAKAS